MADKKISALTSATTPLAGTEVLPIVQSGTTVKTTIADVVGAGTSPGSFTQVNTTGTTSAVRNILTATTGAPYSQYTNTSSSLLVGKENSAGGSFGATAYASVIFEGGNYPIQAFINGAKRFVLETNSDATLTAGNLVIGTSGKGIDFSATSGSGTSELLADYEEGTWTPTQGGGLVVVGSFSSEGTYTIIGRTVVLRGKVTGSTSVAVAANTVLCGGLPVNSNVNYSVGSVTNANLSATGAVIATGATIYSTAIAATTDIYFTVTYYV